MESERTKESLLYPMVESWMKKHFRCFQTGKNVGLKYSRVDVLGVRDVGGILSGEVETICIEVKRGSEPFATASGQAYGYSVYADRVYLADRRSEGFAPLELEIADHLGIGLIQIREQDCVEVISSKKLRPIPQMSLEIIKKLGLAYCQFCGSVFEFQSEGPKVNSKVVEEDLGLAIAKGKGMKFRLRLLSERKKTLGIGRGLDGFTMEQRYVCPECVQHFFGADRKEK